MKNRFLMPKCCVPIVSLACLLATTFFAKAQSPPYIAAGPNSQIIAVGSNVTFSVIAFGSTPLNYQWRFNGTNLLDGDRIAGASSSSLTISNAQYADAGAYSVVVSNFLSWDTSTNAQLQVFSGFTLEEATDSTNLVWQTDPANPWTWQNYSTHDGLDAAQSGATWWMSSYMQTSVQGPAAVNFWWRASFHPGDHMAVLLDGNELARVSGNTPWESVSVFIPTGSHDVRWLYSKDQPFGTYDIKGYVDQVTVTAPTLPLIMSGPTNQTVPAGTNITLSASATGMLPISYQWQFNGTNVDGATNSSLALINLQSQHSGDYSLIVSNGAGTATNPPATITVVPVTPSITQQPQNLTAYYGISTTFSVAATGTEPFSYQWEFNGTNLAGETGSSLTLTNPQPSSAGTYYVTVSNNVGATKSSPAILTAVNPVPNITLMPSNKVVALGGTTFFSVGVSGYDLKYQWRLNGTNLAAGSFVQGPISATLTLPKVRSYQAGSYSVIVSNAYGVASSGKGDLIISNVVAWGAGTTTNYSDSGYGQSMVPPNLTKVVALSGGRYHSLALNNDGTVVAWGIDHLPLPGGIFYGQTIVPPGLSNVTAIAAGGYHSLALKNDGTVVAWGAGTNRQPNSTINVGQSMVPTNLSNIKAIAAGTYHSLALKSDGTVVSWGAQTNVPANLSNVTAIAAGSAHSLALLSNGRVVAWGTNSFSVTNVPTTLSNVIAIAAGDFHNLALRNDGSIVTWGKSVGGPPSSFDFAEIAAGGDHNIAVRTNGTVFAWGNSANGLSNLPNLPYVIHATAGYMHNMALLSDGAPVIKYSPPNRAAFAGENVTLNVWAITGSIGPVGYQWRRDGTNFIGATRASLNFPNVQYTNAGTYVVVITNIYGSVTSPPVALSVTTGIATTNLGVALDATNLVWTTSGNATWFGESNIFFSGSNAVQSGVIGNSQQSSLQTTVIGPGSLNFYWKVSSEEYFDKLSFYAGGDLKFSISGNLGWDSMNYIVPTGPQTLEWRYVKDFSSSVGHDAGWVDHVSFTPAPAFIATQPEDQWATMGGNAQFFVQTVGTGPITYQWRKGGNAIAGATNATLLLTNITRSDKAQYAVTIQNPGGTTNSSSASLTVLVPQRLTRTSTFDDGAFELLSAYVDNWPIQSSDLSRFEAQVSSNLVDWVLLSNALTITNSQILMRDVNATNWPMRYYRIVEH